MKSQSFISSGWEENIQCSPWDFSSAQVDGDHNLVRQLLISKDFVFLFLFLKQSSAMIKLTTIDDYRLKMVNNYISLHYDLQGITLECNPPMLFQDHSILLSKDQPFIVS